MAIVVVTTGGRLIHVDAKRWSYIGDKDGITLYADRSENPIDDDSRMTSAHGLVVAAFPRECVEALIMEENFQEVVDCEVERLRIISLTPEDLQEYLRKATLL